MPRPKNVLGNQQPLAFDSLPLSADLLVNLKRALTRTIRKKYSRAVLAVHLTRVMGKKITVDILNNWTCESKPHHAPPWFAVIYICDFYSDYSPLKVLLKPFGLDVITKKETELLQIGSAYLKQQAIDAEMKKIIFRRGDV